MALIWHKTAQSVRYEVRTAGNTRRLYTDGVLHSQFNPRQPVTGSVWDLLMLPAFFYPPGTVRRVLVLGVGGGAVIRQLQAFLQPEQIVGVDLSALHLTVARRFFGVRGRRVRLYQADAVDWVHGYEGPPFDLVIDDVFGGEDGEPVRAVEASAVWFQALLRLLSRQGALVMNFVSGDELRRSAYFSQARIARRFKAAFQLTTPQDANAVAAFLRTEAQSGALRRRLAEMPLLDTGRKTCRLRYRIRSIARP